VLQCVAVFCSVVQCVEVCCSVLQCVAVCCSMVQCVCSEVQPDVLDMYAYIDRLLHTRAFVCVYVCDGHCCTREVNVC